MMGIVNKKKLILSFLIGVLPSVLLGCQSSSTSSTSNELEFWTMQLQPQFNNYFAQVNNKFETNNQAIKIRWVDIPWSSMESKILTSISAKTAPDVVNLNPNFASQLATRNAWLDLNRVVSPQIQQTYLPKIWQASTIQTCQESNCQVSAFGIPWYLTTPVTIYNQELFKKAEISKAPATYEELAKVAQQIKQKTGKYAFFVTFVPGDSNQVLESLVQMGVQLVDAQGKAAFNTPEGIAAFRYWVDLYKQGLLPPEVLTEGHRYAVEQYQAGEIALVSSGAEFFQAIEKNAPTIAAVSAAAPQITGKTGKKTVAVMNLVIPRHTDKPEEAVKYALYVTDTENQLAFAKETNVFPSTKEAVKQYIQEIEQQKSTTPLEQVRKISASQLDEAEVLIPAMNNLNKLQQIIYDNLQAAMTEEKTVEQALTDAAAEWNEVE